MKISTKIATVFLSISLLSIGIAGGVCFFYFENVLTRQIFDHLNSAATAQKNRLEILIESEFEKMSLVSGRSLLLLALENFSKDRHPEDLDAIHLSLAGVKSSTRDFRELYVLDSDGRVAASTNQKALGQDYASMDFFTRGKEGNFIDMFPLRENEKPKIYLFGPLLRGKTFLGVLLIETDLSGIVSSLRDFNGLGETGETVLAKRDENGDALFLMPLRFDKEAALRRGIPKRDTKVAMTQALLKKESLFTEFIDYRGKPILAATRYIEKLDWGLVVKMDREEVYAPIVTMRNFLLLTAFTLSLLVVIASLYISKGLSSPIILLAAAAKKIALGEPVPENEVKSNDEIGQLASAFNRMAGDLKRDIAQREKLAEQNRLILERTIEGFWIVDLDGRILEANDAYCAIIGYSREELLTMRIPDIEAAESPEETAEHIKNVVREGTDFFESRHRRKDGTVIDVEVSVNFMDIDGGRFFSFVRDITGRKETEAALNREMGKLAGANAELESFNRLSVGRELKMIELKREINDLLRESGREEKYMIHETSEL